MPALTSAEIDALLAGPIIARLATVTPEGTPYIAAVWQSWDGETLQFIPREKARFMAHLDGNPQVAVSCADGVRHDHSRVLIEGRAEIVEGPILMAGETLAMAEEMARRYGGEDGLTYLAGTLDKPRYRVRVIPRRITSWRVAWHPRY